jgi:hypothetical protein
VSECLAQALSTCRLLSLLLLLIFTNSQSRAAVLPDPVSIPFIHFTGHWDAVPTNAPDHEFKKILISKDGTAPGSGSRRVEDWSSMMG